MRFKGLSLVWGMLTLLVFSLIFSTAYHALASANDMTAYPAPGQLVDVGGRRLHILCKGTGEPAVVLEAGMGRWSTDWALVQPEVARVTRVCAYDRAGYGRSDPDLAPRDSQHAAAELIGLLANAGIEGRVILVGHSLGGLFAQYYARANPDQVAGLVLVDAVHPEQSLTMDEDERKAYEGNLQMLASLSNRRAPAGILRLSRQTGTVIADKLPLDARAMARSIGYRSGAYRALHGEMASFQASQAQVLEAGALPDIPLAVISSTRVEDFPPGFSEGHIKSVWDALQIDLAAPATAPQVIARESGHYIPIDQPELVIDAIHDMVEEVRAME